MDDERSDVRSIVSDNDKSMATLSHLSAFAGHVVPLGHIIFPLVIYLMKRDQSDYIRHHSAEALNFQISMTIFGVVAFVLAFVLVGFVLMGVLWIMDIVLTIMAAYRASNSIWYRYPVTIRFVS